MIHSLFSSISYRIRSGPARDGVPLLNIPVDDTQNDINSSSLLTGQTEATNGNCAHDNGTHLRAKLRFFFMSPCWKWHLKRQFPWKAWFQFIKIIILTTQVNSKIFDYIFKYIYLFIYLVNFIWY
jgi:hypothetical protein